MEAPATDYLLSTDEFCKKLGNLSRTTLWRLQQKGIVPQPLKMGGRKSYYRAAWVSEVIDKLQRVEQSA